MYEIFGSMPETSWLRPVFAVELPADHNDRILPKTTLGQWRLSFEVADAVIEAGRRDRIQVPLH